MCVCICLSSSSSTSLLTQKEITVLTHIDKHFPAHSISLTLFFKHANKKNYTIFIVCKRIHWLLVFLIFFFVRILSFTNSIFISNFCRMVYFISIFRCDYTFSFFWGGCCCYCYSTFLLPIISHQSHQTSVDACQIDRI